MPVLWTAFIFSAWWVATQPLPWHGVLAMVLTTGTVGGFCINLGHELGHKNTALERKGRSDQPRSDARTSDDKKKSDGRKPDSGKKAEDKTTK